MVKMRTIIQQETSTLEFSYWDKKKEKKVNFHRNSKSSAGKGFRYLFKYKKAISEAIRASESRQHHQVKRPLAGNSS